MRRQRFGRFTLWGRWEPEDWADTRPIWDCNEIRALAMNPRFA